MSEYYNWKEIVAKNDEEELARIVRERNTEPGEKVVAVLNELKNRGIEGKDDAAILREIQERGLPDPSLPTLYSQQVIYVFSILFSVLFGGVLFAINLKEADKKKGIWPVVIFTLGFTALVIYISTLTKVGGASILLGILYAYIINNIFWRNYIGKETKYNKKSYRTPLIIALAIFIPLTILALWFLHLPK